MNGENLLLLSFILFSLFLLVFLTNRNLLIMLMSLELMLNAANIALVNFAFVRRSAEPAAWLFMLFAVAAAEAGIGLAILLMLARTFKTLRADLINKLRG